MDQVALHGLREDREVVGLGEVLLDQATFRVQFLKSSETILSALFSASDVETKSWPTTPSHSLIINV